MIMPKAETMNNIDRNLDTGELKRPVIRAVESESLSEWELARMTSKTWSMEQE